MQKFKDFIYYNRKELLIGLLCILVVINFFLKSDNKEVIETSSLSDIEKKEEKTEKRIFVDIKGEIKSPGTYEMNVEDRVSDVVLKAGGLTDKASTEDINLSEKVKDEMVIIIPSVNDKKAEDETESKTSYIIPKNNEVTDKKISINTATKETLMKIKGIGEKKAESIVEYRSKNGKFKSIEEIMKVSGIGKSIFDKIKDYIKV